MSATAAISPAGHPELGICVKTLYNYIDQGILLSRNIHLKRKVKFKPRKKKNTAITNRAVFTGRTYHAFKSGCCDELDFAEMDTVLSARGSDKCILTLYFPCMELLIGRLMDRCTQGAVKAKAPCLRTFTYTLSKGLFAIPLKTVFNINFR